MKSTIKESEIRPDELKDRQNELLEGDVRLMLKYRDEFRSSDCPACGSSRYDFVFEKYSLSFTECESCGTIFTNPRPSPNAIREYYTNSKGYQFWATQIFPQTERTRTDKIFKPRLNYIKSIISKTLGLGSYSVLEVGPGFGTFAALMKNDPFFREVSVVEPTPSLANAVEEKGIAVYRSFFEQAKIETKFDVILAFEVIEHILEPKLFVEKCSELLNPKGVVVVTCPNAASLEISLLGEKSLAVDAEHVNLFSPKGLEDLFTTSGFCLVEFSTPGGLDFDLIQKGLDHSSPKFAKLLFKSPNIDGNLLQQFIVDSKISSHMIMAFNKS